MGLTPFKKLMKEVRENADLRRKVNGLSSQARIDSGIEGRGTNEQHQLAKSIREICKEASAIQTENQL